ncbi:MAG: nitroreductase family protein [Spirochaetota bacterium]
MDTFESILTRRSIRRYTGETIGAEPIRMILEAGMAAPSAGNQQPWHFIVLDDRALLDAVPEHHPHSSMIREAPVAILVCGDIAIEKHQGYWVQDCAAATENMLLAVTALGLGAVWLGVYPREDRVRGLKGLLGLPDNIIPFSLIPIGRPAEEKPPAGRYDPSRVHFNRW